MPNPSINMPDGMQPTIDHRRHATTSRSRYVQEAIIVRFYLEDTGDWTDVLAAAKASDSADLTTEE